MAARGDHNLNPDAEAAGFDLTKLKQVKGGEPTSDKSGFANVRVNNPAEAKTFIDQTTQSETSVTVSGKNVVVGFNDSQTTGLFLIAGSDLNGYAYSTNGGQSFTDGGQIPNAPGDIGFGDPWVVSDSAGNFYFSSLVDDSNDAALAVQVSKSTNGHATAGRAGHRFPTYHLSRGKSAQPKSHRNSCRATPRPDSDDAHTRPPLSSCCRQSGELLSGLSSLRNVWGGLPTLPHICA